MIFGKPQIEQCVQALFALYTSIRDDLLQLTDAELEVLACGEWTKKEILGHCCDATATNIQRVVRIHYEEKPPGCYYNQSEWVSAQNYAICDWGELVEYWFAGNRHLINIYKNMPASSWAKSIAWYAGERSALWFFHHHFVRHNLHHLEQILSDPIPIPECMPQFDSDGNPIKM